MNKVQIIQLSESMADLDQQVIMPTHLDLVKSKQRRFAIQSRSSLAIFVKKIVSNKKEALVTSLDIDKETLQELCVDFSRYDFLVNFQYAKGSTFNQEELGYMEAVQQLPELKYLSMVERDPHQTVEEFNEQLDDLIGRNPRKTIVFAMEPNSYRLIEKIKTMGERGLKACSIIFRGAKKQDRAALSVALSNLRGQQMFSVVLGVHPRKHRTSSACMFLPPLQFKCNAVSTWVPWGGGLAPVQFLCSDWLIKDYESADAGLASYDGATRAEVLSETTGVSYTTALSRIDLINQADLMARAFAPLSEIQFESLFD